MIALIMFLLLALTMMFSTVMPVDARGKSNSLEGKVGVCDGHQHGYRPGPQHGNKPKPKPKPRPKPQQPPKPNSQDDVDAEDCERVVYDVRTGKPWVFQGEVVVFTDDRACNAAAVILNRRYGGNWHPYQCRCYYENGGK